MKKLLLLIALSLSVVTQAAKNYDNPDTIVVARDGTGEFRTVDEAIEVCRAFMDYHKVIYIKKGTYKEKLIIPQWLQNIELCGEDRDETIISYDDHANVKIILGTASPREQKHHHREQLRPTGTSCSPPYRRRPSNIHQLSVYRSPRHHLYRHALYAAFFQRLLHLRYDRLYLRSINSLV